MPFWPTALSSALQTPCDCFEYCSIHHADTDTKARSQRNDGKFDHTGVKFVYPQGCTLQLASPAVPLFHSGLASHPQRSCIVALSEDMTMEAKRARGIPLQSTTKVCRGRVMVVGSSHMLGDEWINKEQNGLIAKCALLQYIR